MSSSGTGSVQEAMSLASNHGNQDLLCEWVPTKTWQSCSESVELPHDGSQIFTAREIDADCGLNLSRKRRKLQQTSLVFPIEPRTDELSISAVDKCPSETRIEYQSNVVIASDSGFSASNSFLDSQRLDNDLCLQVKCSRNFDVNSQSQIVGSSKEFISGDIPSSESEMGVDICRTKTNVNDISECPRLDIPGSEVLDEGISARESCCYVLRSSGLLVPAGDQSMRSGVSAQILGIRDESSFIQSCEVCGNSENILNMLLCDHCDEAFHPSCCNPKIEILSTDNWFCHRCSKLDCIVSEEKYVLKSPSMSRGNGMSRFDTGPIALMLKHPEPYTSRVRIGESFQAEVPDWSSQIPKDVECTSETLEMDPINTLGLNDHFPYRFPNPNLISNWLQCREVLYDDTRECVEGTICGKWRRAPFSEVQTDVWDCSCSVLWDPRHSDCAVPQELETHEVLKQLKHVEQLRSGLAVMKRT